MITSKSTNVGNLYMMVVSSWLVRHYFVTIILYWSGCSQFLKCTLVLLHSWEHKVLMFLHRSASWVNLFVNILTLLIHMDYIYHSYGLLLSFIWITFIQMLQIFRFVDEVRRWFVESRDLTELVFKNVFSLNIYYGFSKFLSLCNTYTHTGFTKMDPKNE